MSISPRPVPSPHPNISQDTMKPTVPDVSLMDNEYETGNNAGGLVGVFEKMLGSNKPEMDESSIELPRRKEMDERFIWDDTRCLMNRKRNEQFVRKKSMTSQGATEITGCWDEIDKWGPSKWDLSVYSDQISSAAFSIPPQNFFPTSTPSHHMQSFKMDQFLSPIHEEAAIRQNSSPRARGAVRINYSDSVKISQKQNYHRNDVSIQMLKLGEKYLSKHNTTREENQRLNNVLDDYEYSLASAKYLHKHELLPKNYKIKENDNKLDRSKADFSTATQQYMEKHGLSNKNIKQPHNHPENDQNQDDSFDIIPKYLHGKKLN